MNYLLHQLSKRDVERLVPLLSTTSYDRRKNTIWAFRLDRHTSAFLIDKKTPFLVEVHGDIVPYINSASHFEAMLSKFFVDQGAADRVIEGADLMSPGVTRYELNFKTKLGVVYSPAVEAIAVGKLDADADSKLQQRHGKVLFNLHHRGDWIQRAVAEVTG